MTVVTHGFPANTTYRQAGIAWLKVDENKAQDSIKATKVMGYVISIYQKEGLVSEA